MYSIYHLPFAQLKFSVVNSCWRRSWVARNDGRFFKSFPRVSDIFAIIFALYFLIHRSLSKGDLVCKKFKNVEYRIKLFVNIVWVGENIAQDILLNIRYCPTWTVNLPDFLSIVQNFSSFWPWAKVQGSFRHLRPSIKYQHGRKGVFALTSFG